MERWFLPSDVCLYQHIDIIEQIGVNEDCEGKLKYTFLWRITPPEVTSVLPQIERINAYEYQ